MPEEPDSYSREELLRIFKNSVSPGDLERILGMDPPLSRKIENRVVTCLFTDMRGATDLELRIGQQAASALIIAVLEAIQEEVIAAGGYLDKFVGDEVMALFGAPFELEPGLQAKVACAAALAAGRRSAELGAIVGVGMNTGIVSIGCFSTRAKPMYTVMGDNVNLAARLEGMSKSSGNRPLLPASVRDLVDDDYRTAFFDRITVRGRPEPLAVYALVGPRPALSREDSAFWDRYDDGVTRLEAGDAEGSLGIFEQLEREQPGDSLFATALERARKGYAAGIGARFSAAPDMAGLGGELSLAAARLIGAAPIGLLEPGLDDLWRFRSEAPFAPNEILLAPGGEALIWLRGLAGPGGPRVDSATRLPPPLDASDFGLVLPIRHDNELAAALVFPGGGSVDVTALTELARAFVAPWRRLRAAELGERFREKYDDAAKLEEVNRELESQSATLAKAMASLEGLNRDLEVRAQEAGARLERAAALKRYLPPSVVEDIIEGRRDLAPRTERRKITVLFSDVRGFTQATDGLEPEELARLLDEYLSAMSAIAFAAGATIDKFRGDGMMLLFGAPEPAEAREGALRCLRMAVEMSRDVERLRAKWFDEGYDWDLGVRMGINTGYATVGEFGSAERMDYTAIGTEVNLAARLEGCCETDSIVVSHATWALIRDEYRCDPLGEIEVKGIHKPVRAYRVDWKGPAAGEMSPREDP